MSNKNYNKTKISCYLAYVAQAVVVTFAPLLFIHFRTIYGISLGQIALIPVLFFVVQLIVDMFCAAFVDRIGYRKCILASEALIATGLIGLAFLPEMIDPPFTAILICTVVYAVGSGLTEVLCNPIIEACPFDNKDSVITALSAVYSFGCVGTVLVSTLFFHVVGIEKWQWLSIALAVIPAINIFNFATCPIDPIVPSSEIKMPAKELFGNSMFLKFFIMMICAGATEQAISQWASAYAEASLKVSKEIGDISGLCAFALAEGTGRVLNSKYGEKIKLVNLMIISGVVCLVCYIGVCLFSVPVMGLACCILCGLFVGVLWPGTINAAAGFFPTGGTAMFSILAMAGDIGCSIGPGIVGKCADLFGDNLRSGMSVGCVFPLLFIIALLYKKNLGR